MSKQLDIFEIHERENNKESQQFCDTHRTFLNKNCQKVFDWLLEGKRITVLQAANDGVASLPRRLKDLSDKGVVFTDVWEGNSKTWFMTEHQIKENSKWKSE